MTTINQIKNACKQLSAIPCNDITACFDLICQRFHFNMYNQKKHNIILTKDTKLGEHSWIRSLKFGLFLIPFLPSVTLRDIVLELLLCQSKAGHPNE